MKKRGIGLLFLLSVLIFSSGFVSAGCGLTADLINQDPYPAIPGDYVKVVFQLDGLGNPECGTVTFDLIESYPFSLDPGEESSVTIRAGTYSRDFRSSLIIPYELRIDEEALDGDNPIEVTYYSSSGITDFSFVEEFNINIDDVRVDFELSVKDYNFATNTITFEIINIGENDVDALAVDIPQQVNVVVKGSSRNIVGDLDSNEDASFKFEAVPQDGEIELVIRYSDEIGERRTMTKKVVYESSYFVNRKADQSASRPASFYLLVALILIIVVWWVWKRRKRRKERLAKFNHGKRK